MTRWRPAQSWRLAADAVLSRVVTVDAVAHVIEEEDPWHCRLEWEEAHPWQHRLGMEEADRWQRFGQEEEGPQQHVLGREEEGR